MLFFCEYPHPRPELDDPAAGPYSAGAGDDERLEEEEPVEAPSPPHEGPLTVTLVPDGGGVGLPLPFVPGQRSYGSKRPSVGGG